MLSKNHRLPLLGTMLIVVMICSLLISPVVGVNACSDYGIEIESVSGINGSTESPLLSPLTINGEFWATAYQGHPGQYSIRIYWGENNSSGSPAYTDLSANPAITDSGFSGSYSAQHSYRYFSGTKAITIYVYLYHSQWPGKDRTDAFDKILDIRLCPIINVSYGTGGFITPPGPDASPSDISVPYHSSKSFVISANENYRIANVLIDNVSQGEVADYNFHDIIQNHTISVTFDSKPGPGISLTGGTFIYNGDPQEATGFAYGGGGLEDVLAPAVIMSYHGSSMRGVSYGPTEDAPVNAGNYTCTATFAGNESYLPGSTTASIIVNKSNSTTILNINDAGFNGSAHSGTATVIGAGGLNQNLEVKYTGRNGTEYALSNIAPIEPGYYTAFAAFEGDDNHSPSSDSKDFIISFNTAFISLDAQTLNQAYCGSPRLVTATTNPDGLAYLVTYTQSGSPASNPTNSGEYQVKAAITDLNYSAEPAEGTLRITKADPVIHWTNPADLNYGTPLSNIQLNATSDVSGLMTYNPGPGAVLKAGTHTLSLIFTPDDIENYNSISASATFTISTSNLTIKASNTTKIYGQSLSFTGTEITANGLLNGDSVSSASLTSEGTAANAMPGIYNITANNAVGTGLDNYAISYLNGVLTVIPASGGGENYAPAPIATPAPPTPTPTPSPANIPESPVIPMSSITITPPPASSPPPEPVYLTIDFSGNTTRGLLDNNGALISDLLAGNSDGSNSIKIRSGTIVTDRDGKNVTRIQVTETQIPSLPDNKVALSKAYDFQPSPAHFSNSINVSLSYDAVNMPQKLQSICLAYYTPQSGWQDLTKPEDTVAGARACCGEVNHFTVFAVVANRAPANFSLTQVQINRSLEKFTDIVTFFLTTGRNAIVTGLVTNEGGCNGIYDGTLLLDEKPMETQNMNLQAGENRPLTFIIRNLSPGMHKVQIGSFKYNVPGAESWINWWLISGILIAIALFVWLINRRFKGSRKIDRGSTKVKS